MNKILITQIGLPRAIRERLHNAGISTLFELYHAELCGRFKRRNPQKITGIGKRLRGKLEESLRAKNLPELTHQAMNAVGVRNRETRLKFLLETWEDTCPEKSRQRIDLSENWVLEMKSIGMTRKQFLTAIEIFWPK